MKINPKYPKLFAPLQVGTCLLRNRIIAAPITSYAEEASPADKWESMAAKARGGAGMLVVGSVAVNEEEALIYHASGSVFGHEKKIFEEEISMAHQYGAKISCELFHGGLFADCRGSGRNPIGPCDMERSFTEYAGYERIEPDVVDQTRVIGMNEEMMQQVCKQYAASARECRRMGFDLVMLHFAHGWLIDEFLSPFFNKREDQYGGSLENRMRFPIRVVQAVRAAVGPDYPIDIRIGASERVKESVSLEDITAFIARIEPLINMVHVSSGLDKLVGATSYIESPSIHPHGLNVEYAAYIKAHLDHIPVAVVGGITTPDEAEEILAAGKADLIALGRAFIADPDWANKARDGHAEDIRTCLRCVSCYGVATAGCSQGCAVNPRYERELRLAAEEYQREKAIKTAAAINGEEAFPRRRVVIIGGGPAGMNAAIEASDAGHEVILLEKEDALGGLLRISDSDPMKIDMYNYKKYLIRQVKKRPIQVRLGCKADPQLVAELDPDEIIAALGSSPRKLKIPGSSLPSVCDIIDAHNRSLGQKVVIIGGGVSGCELALSLAGEGHDVTIVEASDKIAATANLLYRGALEELVRDRAEHLTVKTLTLCDRIEEDGVWVRPAADPTALTRIEADNVVYSIGMVPRNREALQFGGLVYDMKVIGDCLMPRRINEAAHEGYFAGHYIV